jgi:predicted nucleic acid-binding protein
LIYLDSSALLKLLFEEHESAALADWLTERAGLPRVSSQLSTVEVLRACRRIDAAALPDARTLLAQLDLVPLVGPVVQQAGDLDDPGLRSLDALHLASALSIGADLETFVAYDRRLLGAASASGLPTCQPGA